MNRPARTRARTLSTAGMTLAVVGLVLSLVLEVVGSDSVSEAGNVLFILCLVVAVALLVAAGISAMGARAARRSVLVQRVKRMRGSTRR